MNINAEKISELAGMAAALDSKTVAEVIAKMEAELTEKMKIMSPEDRLKLLAVQKVVTQRTVEALSDPSALTAAMEGAGFAPSALLDQNALNGRAGAGGMLLDNLKANADPETVKDERAGAGGMLLDNLKANADPETIKDAKLLRALRSGDLEEFKQVFQEQKREPTASVRFVTDAEGHPLIHWAALDNHVPAIQYLLSMVRNRKTLLDQRNVRGEAALHWACLKGNTKTIHELIRAGADIHATCLKGYCAMHFATQNGHVVTMAQLAREGLQVDVRDNNGRTPLHWAAYKGFADATRWLLSHGADSGAQDGEYCMPIHRASIHGHVNLVKLLVERGASGPYLKIKDKTGGTPMSLAQEKVDKITRELADNPALEQQAGRNTLTKQQYEQVVEYCRRRQVIEDMIEANGGKPTLAMRIDAKIPYLSYFLWPVLAPIGWWKNGKDRAPVSPARVKPVNGDGSRTVA